MPWARVPAVSCPDPTSHEETDLVTIEQFLCLCRVSSIDVEQSLITCLHRCRTYCNYLVHTWMTWHYFIGLSKIKTVDSAQPKNYSMVTFFWWEMGSRKSEEHRAAICSFSNSCKQTDVSGVLEESFWRFHTKSSKIHCPIKVSKTWSFNHTAQCPKQIPHWKSGVQQKGLRAPQCFMKTHQELLQRSNKERHSTMHNFPRIQLCLYLLLREQTQTRITKLWTHGEMDPYCWWRVMPTSGNIRLQR